MTTVWIGTSARLRDQRDAAAERVDAAAPRLRVPSGNTTSWPPSLQASHRRADHRARRVVADVARQARAGAEEGLRISAAFMMQALRGRRATIISASSRLGWLAAIRCRPARGAARPANPPPAASGRWHARRPRRSGSHRRSRAAHAARDRARRTKRSTKATRFHASDSTPEPEEQHEKPGREHEAQRPCRRHPARQDFLGVDRHCLHDSAASTVRMLRRRRAPGPPGAQRMRQRNEVVEALEQASGRRNRVRPWMSPASTVSTASFIRIGLRGSMKNPRMVGLVTR